MENLNLNEMNVINGVAGINNPKTLIYPTLNSIIIPEKPDYVNGERFEVNSFGTTDLKNFNGSSDDLIKLLNADFNAVRSETYHLVDRPINKEAYALLFKEVLENKDDSASLYAALRKLEDYACEKYIKIKNNDVLVHSKNKNVIGTGISKSYGVVDFTEAIQYFMALINEIASHGYEVSPAYGRVYEGGAKLFLQYKIGGNKINGEPVDTYCSLITSHDKTLGFTIALSCVRLFCKNQINRLLKSATNKISLKHTNGNLNRIKAEAAQLAIEEQKYREALNSYCEKLLPIKVSNEQMFDALTISMDMSNAKTQKALTSIENRASQLFACYNMEDVNNFRGTAYGAFLAVSDMVDHVTPLRASSKELTGIQRGIIENNPFVTKYMDVLTSIAK